MHFDSRRANKLHDSTLNKILPSCSYRINWKHFVFQLISSTIKQDGSYSGTNNFREFQWIYRFKIIWRNNYLAHICLSPWQTRWDGGKNHGGSLSHVLYCKWLSKSDIFFLKWYVFYVYFYSSNYWLFCIISYDRTTGLHSCNLGRLFLSSQLAK